MTEDHPSRVVFLSFVLLFAFFMLFVLLSAVRTTHGDVIRPNVDTHIISIGASGVSYDAESGVLTVSDDTAAFSYLADGTLHFIYNLSADFGGSYLLRALYDSTGGNAALDGLFTTVGDDSSDLVIQGEIPSLNITVANGYSGTLLEANVIAAEFFAYGTSNNTAEYNLLLEVVGGDLVKAGQYDNHTTIGMLSSLFTLNPSLPGGFGFDGDFTGTFQSGTIGVPIPEPATLALTALGAFAMLSVRRLRKRPRA